MWWLISFLVVVIAIWLFVVSKTFRILAIAVLVLVVGGIFAWFEYQERQTRIAQSLIKHEEIEIRDLFLSKKSFSSYRLSGSLKNLNPSYTLSSMRLNLTFYDCPTGGGDKPEDWVECEIIGEEQVSLFLTVPPGQVRGFDRSVYVSDLPKMKRRFAWGYSIESTRADKK